MKQNIFKKITTHKIQNLIFNNYFTSTFLEKYFAENENKIKLDINLS